MTTASSSSPDGVDGQAPTLPAWLSARAGSEVPIPERIAHYRLGEKLGEGGMGVVYAATDEVLEREVAVKLLRADRTDVRSKVKMLQEAKALAKLSHPNIVPIYGAGEERGHVYFAMERVEGRTLREVRDDDAIDWRGRLELYVQAGHGLAAAHRADLVHRDFKPSNALVGRDGRVRVVDFGLARALEAMPADRVEPSAHAEDTETDAMAGTPAYMSPEQRTGMPAGARADQYSFCASLWEALFGDNPIRKTPLIQLLDGELTLEVPRKSPVPGSVVAALRRGLQRDPDARHPSMDTLLEALTVQTRGRRRGLWLGAVGVTTLVGAWLLGGDAPCVDEPTGLLGSSTTAALEQSWASTGVPADSRAAMQERVSAFERQWTATRRAACEAHAHGETSTPSYERQLACLEERRAELQAALTVSSVQALDVLRDPGVCGADEADPYRPPPPPPGATDRRLELREGLADARVRLTTLELGPLAEQLEALRGRAEGDVPILAELGLLEGRLQRHHGRWTAATTTLQRAFEQAEASGYRFLAASAAVELASLLGDTLARRGEGEVWVTVAQSKLQGLDVPELTIDLAIARAAIAVRHARIDEARPILDDALSRAREHYGAEHPEIATVHDLHGAVELLAVDLDAATRSFEASLEIRRSVFGERHPQVADTLANLAKVAMERGDLDRARSTYTQALETLEETDPRVGTSRAEIFLGLAETHANLGAIEPAREAYHRALAALPVDSDAHPTRALILAAFAGFESREGDYEAAVEMAKEALSIQEAALGNQHPFVAVTLNALGTSLQSLERYEEAKRHLARAVEIHRAVHGPRSAEVAAPLSNLALIEQAQGNLDVARELLTEVLELEREALGPEHPNLVFDHYFLARVEREAGRPADAVGHLRAAEALDHPALPVRAEVAVALVDALHAAGRPWATDATRARALVESMGDADALRAFDEALDAKR